MTSQNIMIWLSTYLTNRAHLRVLLVFTFFLAVFCWVYFSVNTLSSGDDHFFHFRFAEQIRENGLFNSFSDFKSIYLSKMAQGNEYYVYYNFIFYLLILPFTYIQPLALGIKLYAAIMVALSFTILYWSLDRFKVQRPFVWTIAVLSLTSTSAIWRLFLSRPYAFAPALLLLFLVFLKEKKYWGVFFLGAIYFFWHTATFYFPFGIAFIYYIFEAISGKPADRKSLFAAVGGTVASIIFCYLIAPGVYLYMKEIIFGVYVETILGKKVNLPEGGELYSIDFFNFLQAGMLVLVFFVTSAAVDIYRYAVRRWYALSEIDPMTKNQTVRLSLLFISLGLLLGTVLISARFGDYFTFFAATYLVLAGDAIFQTLSSPNKIILRGLRIGMAITIMYLVVCNMLFLQSMLSRGASTTEFSQVGEWLNKNAKPGEVVFNPEWSWFPQLYYVSPQLNYLTGLEPRFSYTYNPSLYWLWSNLSLHGFVCDQERCPELEAAQRLALKTEKGSEVWYKSQGQQAVKVITEKLGSTYIVTSRSFGRLNALLEGSGNFKILQGTATSTYFIFGVK